MICYEFLYAAHTSAGRISHGIVIIYIDDEERARAFSLRDISTVPS